MTRRSKTFCFRIGKTRTLGEIYRLSMTDCCHPTLQVGKSHGRRSLVEHDGYRKVSRRGSNRNPKPMNMRILWIQFNQHNSDFLTTWVNSVNLKFTERCLAWFAGVWPCTTPGIDCPHVVLDILFPLSIYFIWQAFCHSFPRFGRHAAEQLGPCKAKWWKSHKICRRNQRQSLVICKWH